MKIVDRGEVFGDTPKVKIDAINRGTVFIGRINCMNTPRELYLKTAQGFLSFGRLLHIGSSRIDYKGICFYDYMEVEAELIINKVLSNSPNDINRD
jgi:hypothetical protein